MKVNVFLVLFVFCSFNKKLNAVETCDKLGVLFYEDIGCEPIKAPNSECPQKYNCDNLKATENGCMFRGKHYKPSERVDNSVTYAACKVGCFCPRAANSNDGGFVCAILDCPEWLGARRHPDCYTKYELGKCCGVGSVCSNETVATCTVGDETFKEGQRFSAPDECKECVCQNDFKGKFEEPFCRRQICGVQLHDTDKLQQNCAVAYNIKKGNKLCCPSDFICPTSEEEIKVVSLVDEDLKCKFGSKEIKKGEGFAAKLFGSIEVQCECILPPFVSCYAV